MTKKPLPVGNFGKFKVTGTHYKQQVQQGWHVHISPPNGPSKDCWVSGKEIFSAELHMMVRNTAQNALLVSHEPRHDVGNEERNAIFQAIEKWEKEEGAEDDE